MQLRLRPRENAFFELIAQTGQNIAQAGQLLARLGAADADRPAIAAEMRDYEHRGDAITHQILRLLNKSFVTPFDREDIYRLASTLDDVIDALDEAADFMDLANVGQLPDLVADQITVICHACTETGQAMQRLDTLADLEPYWIEVNRLENQADRIHRQILSQLFSGEYDVLAMLKIREVADLLENAADALEHVAHAVETIAVKES
jgi:predicted phosphate transport protein (TIGR00153 family)